MSKRNAAVVALTAFLLGWVVHEQPAKRQVLSASSVRRIEVSVALTRNSLEPKAFFAADVSLAPTPEGGLTVTGTADAPAGAHADVILISADGERHIVTTFPAGIRK